MSHSNVLGFGLDNQYAHDYPGGMSGLCDKFRRQLSHISIVSLPSVEESTQFKNNISQNLPVIHHFSGIAPCDPEGPNLDVLSLQSAISRNLEAIWCLEDIGIWSIGPYGIPYFAPPPFLPQVAKLVGERIKEIIDNVTIPFLAEIPSCSFVLGNQALGEFFWQLVNESNCKVVLDVSHVYSYSLATEKDYFEVLENLPLEAVWEIHVAGGKVSKKSNKRYIDTHSDPVMEEVEQILEQAIKKCLNLRAITYEIGVKSTEDLIEAQFTRLTSIIEKSGFSPRVS